VGAAGTWKGRRQPRSDEWQQVLTPSSKSAGKGLNFIVKVSGETEGGRGNQGVLLPQAQGPLGVVVLGGK